MNDPPPAARRGPVEEVMVRVPEWTHRWAVRAGIGIAALTVAGTGVAVMGGTGRDTSTSVGADMAGERSLSAPATTIPAPYAADENAKYAPNGALGDTDLQASGAAEAAAPPVGGGAGGSSAVPVAGPKVVKTATISMEVGKDKLMAAVDRAAVVAAGHGGFVEGTTTSTADENHANASLTIRVPADRFDAARRELRALGKVETEELAGDDVSDQLVDYDARIRSLQAQEEALRTLLSKATRVGEVLEVQGQLFNVRQQIEQLQAQRAQLDRSASLATLHIRLFEPGAAAFVEKAEEPASGLAKSFEAAIDGAIAVVGGMIVVLGYALPLGAIALVAWFIARLVARLRRHDEPAPTPIA